MVLAHKLRRPKALAAAIVLALASIFPALNTGTANAYGLIQNRKITMSSSANGNTTAGQGLTYEVAFNVASDAEDIAGVVVDFCSDSPIIGDVCTAPTGFDTNFATATLNLTDGLTGFTLDGTNSTANKLVLTGSAYNPGVAQQITFDVEGIDNPETVNETFYARIITFTSAAAAQAYTSASSPDANNPGSEAVVIDAGGIALSTAAQINVTSKVQEKLTFCVYTSAVNVNGDCNLVTGTDIILGDTNGVLDTNGAYVSKNTKYSVTTNASVGVSIRMKGETLQTGGFSISPNGAGSLSVPGTEQFGVCTYRYTGPNPSAAGLDPADKYDGDSANPDSTECSGTTHTAETGSTGGDNGAYFVFDDNNTTGTTSTYGETIATKTAGDFSTGIIAMMANIGNTTEAGIYATTLTFIATGTY